MTTAEFLSRLRERDVRLWLEDGQLKCDAPRGALDDGWREQLTSRKSEVVTLIAEAEATLRGPRSLVPLSRPGTTRPCSPGRATTGRRLLRALATYLDARQTLYGVEPEGLDGSLVAGTVEEMAAYEVEQIRSFQAKGPYSIAGFCAGGAIAFESRQLTQAGEEVARVVLFGSPFPSVYRARPVALQLHAYRALPRGPTRLPWPQVRSLIASTTSALGCSRGRARRNSVAIRLARTGAGWRTRP